MKLAERHAWKLFLALGLLYIAFGVSDVAIAVTVVSRQLAVALIVIGVLQTVISSTALRAGQRWAWLLMWIWPAFVVVDLLVLSNGPTPPVASMVYTAGVAVITVLALVLSSRRYLR